MKDFLKLMKRFVPPYRGKVVMNIIYNILGALFGTFSFAMLIPALDILFKTKELVTEKVEWALTADSITNNINYYISSFIAKHGEQDSLLLIGLILVIATLFKVGFTYLADFVLIALRNGVVYDIRSLIYKKIIGLPLGYFSEERKGDIMARITSDVQEVENSVANSLGMMIKNPILIIVYLCVMIYMSWSLTLFVFVMLPITGLIIGRIGRSLKRVSTKGQNKLGEILSIIEEDLSGLRIIKSFNAEEKAIGRFQNENQNYRLIMNRLMWRRHLAHPASEFLGTIVIVVVLWYGGRIILGGNNSSLTAAEFIGYMVFFYGIINPAKAFSTALYSIEKGLASMQRIDHVLAAKVTIVDKKDAKDIESFEKDIVYKNVTFAYDKAEVLSNVSLNIPKGTTVALVGSSGSGKTTMVDLLPRFWDITSGNIEVDGTDIRDLKLKSLRNLIGNVNQEPILFNDTIRNNIAFGIDDVSDEAVIQAAKIANAHDFILGTKNGYDTIIGDRGDKLSGGQKQRLSIARAILRNPPILILDEATSALDTESEKLVQEALENLMKNRTSLVIAHRLSTIKHANLICVLHEGKIVEQGTHEELMELGGRYKKLHSMQMF
ncbi:antibiotic ABC transporter ATP-binding protein [Draconibacterium sediminis]|uniref:Antibiotic ABC transporter ATP-binding protein n=2 Tax=Draconibacterium sediminis TaxID=1544798 RepID=A0A0D8JG06_9BACT|nr:antibiotic ABC transporter ATP-binding protein [Draconibacterium sediminis]